MPVISTKANRSGKICSLLRSLAVCVGVLFASVHGSLAHAGTNGVKRSPQRIAFVAGSPAETSTLNLVTSKGTEILFQLSPEYDANHQLTVLNLSAHRVSDASKKNLLEPLGRWHGMQPFIFAAPCFGRHADACGYSNPRVFELTTLNVEVRVSVADVSVSPATSQGDYAFRKLQLELTSAPLRIDRQSTKH